jgi:hypothetical protein
MTFLTRSSSKYSKGQFFVLSAFAIVAAVFLLSQWIEPYNIPDTSFAVLSEEPFIFNNIKEKAIATVKASTDCNDLKFNLAEYKKFVEDFVLSKGMSLVFDYKIKDCGTLKTEFNITLKSPSFSIKSSFTATK